MFKPNEIYYEPGIKEYPLGRALLKKYGDVPKFVIENHNNIPEMRGKENRDFGRMKHDLILGTRKTHKYAENHKVSDFLVPYTSSGCSAMCLYCYLVCNYNKCSYMRIFVNREQMLQKIIKTAEKSEKELTFEIGSNSDLVLENQITDNLVWTIENFAHSKKGKLTFPTKFDMVEPILNIKGKENVIIRMSVNPQEIISKIELGTSALLKRIDAINKLKQAGYDVGLLVAPIVLVDNWKELYSELFEFLSDRLDFEVKKSVFFELIFMTYSYVHRIINSEAFPNAPELYSKEMMTGRGRGKYAYKKEIRDEATLFFKELLKKYFTDNKILYIV